MGGEHLCFGLVVTGNVPSTADWQSREFCLLNADTGATNVFGVKTKLSAEQQQAHQKLKFDDRVTCDVDLAAGTMHYSVNGAGRRLAFSGVRGSVHIAVFNDGALRIDAVQVGLTNPPQHGPQAACFSTLPFPRTALHPAHVCILNLIGALFDHRCNVCAAPLGTDDRAYRCANHDFEVCTACWTRQSQAISLANPVPAVRAAGATSVVVAPATATAATASVGPVKVEAELKVTTSPSPRLPRLSSSSSNRVVPL